MIRGVGIDLCETARMERALLRGGFLERFFTPEEAAYIRGRGRGAAESLAGHFAAKEALLKALGCGIALPLTDIAVAHGETGAPYFRLSGEAAAALRRAGGVRAHLSVTHAGGMAAAVAVVEGEEKG